MPTYVYRRPDGTTFEAFQKISDPALAVDPETGVPIVRVISGGAGLQFKGTGFYLTDYGRAGQPPKGEASKKASDGGDSGASSKPSGDSKPATSETKPAAKPTAKPSGDAA